MAKPRIAFRRANSAVAVDDPVGDSEIIRIRRFLAEFLGTFCLTFVAAGGATIAALRWRPAKKRDRAGRWPSTSDLAW